MRDILLPQVGLELPQLLTARQKFVCFAATSRENIDYARSPLFQPH